MLYCQLFSAFFKSSSFRESSDKALAQTIGSAHGNHFPIPMLRPSLPLRVVNNWARIVCRMRTYGHDIGAKDTSYES